MNYYRNNDEETTDWDTPQWAPCPSEERAIYVLDRRRALAVFLNAPKKDLVAGRYGHYTYEEQEFLVLTATDAAELGRDTESADESEGGLFIWRLN